MRQESPHLASFYEACLLELPGTRTCDEIAANDQIGMFLVDFMLQLGQEASLEAMG